jgi:glutamate 5-kinase
MASKVRAAVRAVRAGIVTLVARGTDRDVLVRAMAGADVGTLFLPPRSR